jgi:hypothetical protein
MLRGSLHGQLVFCSVFDFVCYVVLVAEERKTRFTEADFVVFTPRIL